MIEIGSKVTFRPCAFFESVCGFGDDPRIKLKVTGTVIYINTEHRFYRTEYSPAPGCIGHECFKFDPEEE